MNLTAHDAASILASAGLVMPPFSASLADRRLRQLCWRVLYAARGLCVPVHYERDKDFADIAPEPMILNG